MQPVRAVAAICVGLTALSGCANMAPKKASELVDELEPSRKLEPAPQPEPEAVGTVWHGRGGEDGDEITRTELISVEGDEYTFEETSGCRWTSTSAYGGYRSTLPIQWKNCGSAGKRNIKGKEGSLWPMEVGKVVEYEATGRTTTSAGGRWDANWRCEVVDEVRIEVEAGAFDTYKVVCESKWMREIDYYAPRIETSVRSVKRPKGDSAASGHNWQLTRIERP